MPRSIAARTRPGQADDLRNGDLHSGDRIRVEYPKGHAQCGVVDVFTADRSVIWMFLDHGRGRHMVLTDDDLRIFPDVRASSGAGSNIGEVLYRTLS